MLFRAVLLGFWCCASVVSATGQSRTDSTAPLRKHGISVQLGGNAPIISLNYHYTLLHIAPQADRTSRGSVEMGIGLGYTPVFEESGLINVPHYVSINYGSRHVRGEIGYGGTDGRRGLLFTKAGYQPGVIVGIRLVPTVQTTIRLFSWTTFYRDVSTIQDAQLRFVQREAQQYKVFGGVSFVRYLNR